MQKCYHAVTLFIQNGKVFDAATRRFYLSALPPLMVEITEHLDKILSNNCKAQWGRDFEVPNKLEFGDLTGTEIAIRLADPLSNLPVSGISYVILTHFTEYSVELMEDGTLKKEEARMLNEFEEWATKGDNQLFPVNTKTIRKPS